MDLPHEHPRPPIWGRLLVGEGDEFTIRLVRYCTVAVEGLMGRVAEPGLTAPGFSIPSEMTAAPPRTVDPIALGKFQLQQRCEPRPTV